MLGLAYNCFQWKWCNDQNQTSQSSATDKELKSANAKLKRRVCQISNLLNGIYSQKCLQEEEMNILKDKFSEEILTLIENEAKAHEKRKCGFRYPDDFKSFPVSLHVYSAAVYEYVRKLLHLPHSELIYKGTNWIPFCLHFLPSQ